MTNNQKILFVSAGLIGLGLYLFYKQSKQASLAEQPISDENSTQTTKADWNKILKKGSQGIEVEVLQKALKQLDVDGDFGQKTETRLKNVTGFNQISVNQYNDYIKSKKTTTQANKSVFQF